MGSNLVRYDEAGHVHFWSISCRRGLTFFHDDGIKAVAISGLRLLQERFGVCLMGYVIMPEHVHVVLYPHGRGESEPIAISRLLQGFKQHVGYYGKRRLQHVLRQNGRLWSDPLNEWATGGLAGRSLWNTRGYDFNIHREDTLLEKLDYCHKNPITRGLVGRADQWPWSSYRYYEMSDRSVLAMDWDGACPIEW